MEAPATDPTPPPAGPDWEAFYRSYKKPGYVAGYEIGHKLGGGVFGVVFKARKESIGKAYAIKFLRVEDPGVREQVVRELESVSLFAQVDHPNLVSIEDKGLVDGIPFIIMGYAGDETLKSRLEEGALDEEAALQLFVQVARGVQALHEHSLVHFDLKPANVFLKGDVARVGDYGLSKLITETAMSLTTGRGTPYYMAPEMLRRKGDHRSDIYSLGVLLFECLSGDVPFKGESEWEVLKGHEEGEIVFPHSIAPRFHDLLRRMLAKDPEDRCQSVTEVLHALCAPGTLGESVRLELGAIAERVTPEVAQPAAASAAAPGRDGASERPPPVFVRRSGSSRAGWWVLIALIGFVLVARSDGISPLGLLIFVIVIGLLSRSRPRYDQAGRRIYRRRGSLAWLWFLLIPAAAFFLWMLPMRNVSVSYRSGAQSTPTRVISGVSGLIARLRELSVPDLQNEFNRLRRKLRNAAARDWGRIRNELEVHESELLRRGVPMEIDWR